MKQKDLEEKMYQLLKRYKELLKGELKIQAEMRKIRQEIELIAKENVMLETFTWLAMSLNADYFEKTNNLDFSKDEEIIANRLELLSKNQNLKEKEDKKMKEVKIVVTNIPNMPSRAAREEMQGDQKKLIW